MVTAGVTGLVVWVLAATGQPGEVEKERAANVAAFEEQYLRQKEALFRDHAGRFVVIAHGRLGPRDAAGRTAPAATLDEALRATSGADAARHRFVFRVGEEGPVRYAVGASAEDRNLGTRALALLPADWVVGPDGFGLLAPDGTQRVLGVPGPDERPWIAPKLHPPGSDVWVQPKTLVATGFEGFLTLDAATAAALHLERFEVPGSVRLEGLGRSGTGRRSRVRLRFESAGVDLTLPVAIW